MKVIVHDLGASYDELMEARCDHMLSADGKCAPCQGCFGCWTKHPAECFMKDRLQQVCRLIGQADELVIVTRNLGEDRPLSVSEQEAWRRASCRWHWLPGDEIPEAERQFLTKEGLEAANDGTALDIEAVSAAKNSTAPMLDYALGIGFPKLTKWVYYRFEFPLKEFMQKARSLEASPTVLLSALMFMALCNVWPDRKSDIQAMIAQNYRAKVGLPQTTCDLVRHIHVKYPEKLENTTLEKICTITRGQMILQADKAFALRDAAHVLDRIEAVEALPALWEKKRYCLMNGIYGPNVIDSYQVSYLGRTEWGDMAPTSKPVTSSQKAI